MQPKPELETLMPKTKPMKTAICPNCQEEIASFGEACLDACKVACAGCTEGMLATYDPEERKTVCAVVPFLEKKGFLISTEISRKEVAFMPTCRATQLKKNLVGYCWCKE